VSDRNLRELRRLAVQGDREAWERLWHKTLQTRSAALLYDALLVKPDTQPTEKLLLVQPETLWGFKKG